MLTRGTECLNKALYNGCLFMSGEIESVFISIEHILGKQNEQFIEWIGGALSVYRLQLRAN